MKKLLYISYCAPYDSVRHAGGKTHNYYLKELSKSFNIKLVTYVKDDEIDKMDLDKYHIDHNYINYPVTKLQRLWSKIINVESRLNPFNRYGCFVSNYEAIKIKTVLEKLRKEKYIPDVILLEWTQILFLLPIIKKYYPNIPVYEIEVDVAFLGKERIADGKQAGIKKAIAYRKASRVKELELTHLKEVDKVFTNNDKDKQLLISHGIDKVDVLMPFYDDYSTCQYNPNSKNILFFGAMDRPENWKTAIWFIDNVMPLLDHGFTYTVVGNHPPKELLDKRNARVIITGFVEKVDPYFENSLCLASPLVLGAGVKVKIIEAMTSGIPVVCNRISIEGINAINGIDYIHCEKAEEFAEAINRLAVDKGFAETIGQGGKRVVINNYSYIRDCEKLATIICDSIEKERC